MLPETLQHQRYCCSCFLFQVMVTKKLMEVLKTITKICIWKKKNLTPSSPSLKEKKMKKILFDKGEGKRGENPCIILFLILNDAKVNVIQCIDISIYIKLWASSEKKVEENTLNCDRRWSAMESCTYLEKPFSLCVTST